MGKLVEVLQAAPIHNMVAKQAELLEIMEKLKDTVQKAHSSTGCWSTCMKPWHKVRRTRLVSARRV